MGKSGIFFVRKIGFKGKKTTFSKAISLYTSNFAWPDLNIYIHSHGSNNAGSP